MNASTPVEQAADDYVYCLERVYPHASYITVNISSRILLICAICKAVV